MKNNKKGDRAQIEIELLLQIVLGVQQEPNQQINGILMSDYSGFEKVGALGTSLPASNSQTTTQAGDIVLYNGNQIVAFYGSNSWSYTRLGHIDNLLECSEGF